MMHTVFDINVHRVCRCSMAMLRAGPSMSQFSNLTLPPTKQPSLQHSVDNHAQKVSVKIAMASCNQTSMDWSDNVSHILHALSLAAQDDADILLLPELVLTAYACDDEFQRIQNEDVMNALKPILDYSRYKDCCHLIVSIGMPGELKDITSLLTASAFVSNGKILTIKPKNGFVSLSPRL